MQVRPKYIILVRHGESEANRNWSINVSMPNHLIPLTELGHSQARHCGKKIHEHLAGGERIMLVQSPYKRARQTADNIIKELGDSKDGIPWKSIERSEDPRLREQDFGNFQEKEAMRSILADRDNYGMFFYRIPNGESPADVYDRCSSFCETLFRLYERKRPDVVILVSHGIWGRVFLMRYFHWTYEEFESLCNLPNADPVILERTDEGKYEIITKLDRWS